MKIIKQIDSKTRIIKSKHYLPAFLAGAFRLQRKTWYGYKTTSFCYFNTVKGDNIDQIERTLKYFETDIYKIIRWKYRIF